MTQSYEQLVAKYGEDNAKFLYEQLCNMTRNYTGLTFIEMGIEPATVSSVKPAKRRPSVAGSSRNWPATWGFPAIGRRPMG